MKKFKPLVSIIIPVFNGSNFLQYAIDSALQQTYRNIEILVINDGSSDKGKTELIALSYGKKIKYFKKKNGGVSSALNFGISKMKGDYFSWLSHDDVYMPNKIKEQVSFLQKCTIPNAIVYSDFLLFSEDPVKTKKYKITPPSPDSFRYAITVNSFLNGCSLLIPKVVFDECGIFDIKLKHTQDYDMWFRASNKFKFLHLNKVLVKSRIHNDQDSNKYKRDAINEISLMIQGFLKELKNDEIIKATGKSLFRSHLQMSYCFARRGLLLNSIKILRKLDLAGIKSISDILIGVYDLIRILLLLIAWKLFKFSKWLCNES